MTAHLHEPVRFTVPPVVRVDVAAAVRQTEGELPTPCPALLARDLEVLALARYIARSGPRPEGAAAGLNELLDVTLRDGERERWFRDEAEAEVVQLRTKLQELQTQRAQLLQSVFELAAWAAGVLGCAPRADEVLRRIRSAGSGFLREESPASLAERVRQEVANGG